MKKSEQAGKRENLYHLALSVGGRLFYGAAAHECWKRIFAHGKRYF